MLVLRADREEAEASCRSCGASVTGRSRSRGQLQELRCCSLCLQEESSPDRGVKACHCLTGQGVWERRSVKSHLVSASCGLQQLLLW